LRSRIAKAIEYLPRVKTGRWRGHACHGCDGADSAHAATDRIRPKVERTGPQGNQRGGGPVPVWPPGRLACTVSFRL